MSPRLLVIADLNMRRRPRSLPSRVYFQYVPGVQEMKKKIACSTMQHRTLSRKIFRFFFSWDNSALINSRLKFYGPLRSDKASHRKICKYFSPQIPIASGNLLFEFSSFQGHLVLPIPCIISNTESYVYLRTCHHARATTRRLCS